MLYEMPTATIAAVPPPHHFDQIMRPACPVLAGSIAATRRQNTKEATFVGHTRRDGRDVWNQVPVVILIATSSTVDWLEFYAHVVRSPSLLRLQKESRFEKIPDSTRKTGGLRNDNFLY